MELIGVIALVVVVWIWASSALKKKRLAERRAYLMSKYHDPRIVDRIMSRTMWQGQTEEQLTDALGGPVDIDQKVMKNKVRETWKYRQQGANRFGLRITLENGIVVGWDQKG
ncbi:DUF2845 domain-containing protein [uncultured Castellaniella sp.]|uniref:DUF2845 domain-containing protein n=1 Tax=uncultured Castellaniella sp. TaxID=647907 RepID=UPI0026103169|nr:DUF2845 domain-containing protein [uncultured Castellaniella sp.]